MTPSCPKRREATALILPFRVNLRQGCSTVLYKVSRSILLSFAGTTSGRFQVETHTRRLVVEAGRNSPAVAKLMICFTFPAEWGPDNTISGIATPIQAEGKGDSDL